MAPPRRMTPVATKGATLAALLRGKPIPDLIPPEAEFEVPEMIDPNDETLDTKEISADRFIALGKSDSADGNGYQDENPKHEGAETPVYESTEMDEGGEPQQATGASQIRRVMTQRPDGSWVYFQSDSRTPDEYGGGERPAGSSIADLLRRGFVPTSNEEFTRANREAFPEGIGRRNFRRLVDGAPVDEFGKEDGILDQLLAAPKDAANSIAALLRRKSEGM